MCQIFTNADPALYACRARSIRLRGVATSIRLENIFWRVLEEIGERDGLSVPQLVTRLHDELPDTGTAHDRANFTSFLRVSCSRYLQLQVAGLIPADTSVPIRSLNAAKVLTGEQRLQRSTAPLPAVAAAREPTQSATRPAPSTVVAGLGNPDQLRGIHPQRASLLE
ncbi:MAG: ribbon-helix-helix domain-containing protein [Azoarcus sp.]|nr:ribbon-helix-helix domain-containing protein [Azoarcus sp.]PKO55150.1 MAG: aryl-sulfate sulfotransferase [Betaproteobacteria bacterium HGW-Betaproteobacteria-21]